MGAAQTCSQLSAAGGYGELGRCRPHALVQIPDDACRSQAEMEVSAAPLLAIMASIRSMYGRRKSRRLMVADTLRTSAAALSRSLAHPKFILSDFKTIIRFYASILT